MKRGDSNQLSTVSIQSEQNIRAYMAIWTTSTLEVRAHGPMGNDNFMEN